MTSPVSAIEADYRKTLADIQSWHKRLDAPGSALALSHGQIGHVLEVARQAEALRRENAELREALQNLMGCYDTPLSRRRFPPDEFMKEALDIARALLGGSENAE